MPTLARRSHLLFSAVALTQGGYPRYHFDIEGGITAPSGGAVAEPPPAQPDARQEFSRLQTEAMAVLKKAEDEKRELTKEEKTANDQRFSRMKALHDIDQDRARFAGLAFKGDASAPGVVTQPKSAPGRAEFESGEQHRKLDLGDKAVIEELRVAFSSWADSGTMHKKFATITTATSSSALLPRTIGTPVQGTPPNTIREAMDAVGATPMSTTGTEDMKIPVMGTAEGSDVAETASSETENAPDLSETITLNTYAVQSGSAWFSDKVLMANSFDLVAYVQTDLLYAKELRLEQKVIAAMIADAGITQVVTAASATAFTYANLVALNNKLPKKWDRQKAILLSQAAYSAAEGLVGSDGQPILTRDPQNQRLLRFNGTPVLRCDYLEVMTTTKVVGLIIGFTGFKLRDAGQMSLERYFNQPARPAQKGFNLIGHHAHGYAATAVAKLVMA